MADRYWVSNANSTANTAANWNTAADGTGSTGVPTTGDNVFLGHTTTLAANLGNGGCTWDITATIGSMTVYSGYNPITQTSDKISFTAASTITHAEANWNELGYRQGMVIVTTGATNSANNASFTIASLSDRVMTVTATSVVTEAASASITVAYDAYVDVSVNFGMNLLTLDGVLKNTSGSSKTISFSGAYDGSSDNRYILNKDNATVNNAGDIEYSIDSSANGSTALYFDDGEHGKINLTGSTKMSCGYKTPSSTNFEKTTFQSFIAGASVTMAVDTTQLPINNQSKVFEILTTSTFAYSPTTFNAGKSTWKFITDAAFSIPISNDTQTFIWYNLIIATKTAGLESSIPSNRTLSVNSLSVEENAVLKGHSTTGEATSTIISVRRPKILGAWNFSQLTDGVYVSLMETAFPVTPASGSAGTVQISNGAGAFTNDEKLTWASATSTLLVDGKLTVTGLIDPTGMVFTPQASNPETTNPLNTIWIDSETGHLVRGDRDTESTVHFNVRNDEGATIPLGAPLYSKGEIGGSQRIKVGIADASDPAKMPAIGLAMDEMNTTSTKDGNMILTGILNENITITGVSEQDIIYVAPHGGTAPYLTITRPTSGSHLVQNVGVCVKQASANISQGMKVSAIGRTNDIPNGVITTNSADADYVYIDDGNTFKKITPSDLGIGSVPAFQHLRLNLTNNSLASQSAGTNYYLDLANTSNYTSTGDTASIVVTDATQDYISLAAGGMYMVVVSVEMFTGTSTAAQDFWVQLGNDTTSNATRRRWGTARQKVRATSSASDCAINMQKTVIIDVPSTGSNEKLYVIPFLNGATFSIRAYDDNRTNITVTRIGDSTS